MRNLLFDERNRAEKFRTARGNAEKFRTALENGSKKRARTRRFGGLYGYFFLRFQDDSPAHAPTCLGSLCAQVLYGYYRTLLLHFYYRITVVVHEVCVRRTILCADLGRDPFVSTAGTDEKTDKKTRPNEIISYYYCYYYCCSS